MRATRVGPKPDRPGDSEFRKIGDVHFWSGINRLRARALACPDFPILPFRADFIAVAEPKTRDRPSSAPLV